MQEIAKKKKRERTERRQKLVPAGDVRSLALGAEAWEAAARECRGQRQREENSAGLSEAIKHIRSWSHF